LSFFAAQIPVEKAVENVQNLCETSALTVVKGSIQASITKKATFDPAK
jgi:hypothetical protein